ncbi:MAG: hypothetical protein F6K28_61810 [Microcoleus sp. SIO2G3]|nr:hypothetical protein [Microcoleus sp. SIO2G3]
MTGLIQNGSGFHAEFQSNECRCPVTVPLQLLHQNRSYPGRSPDVT